jgi:peptidyl-prolyl cis-trans isomerase C
LDFADLGAPMTMATQTQAAVGCSGVGAYHSAGAWERLRSLLARWLKLRIVQFVLLGGLVFALHARKHSDDAIHVPKAYLEARRAAFALKLGVAQLSPAQRNEVDRRSVEDAVLFREARRLGLDRDDPILAQHLIQKTLLLAEDLGGAMRAPSEGELRSYFEATKAQRTLAARVRFVHAFFRTETAARLAKRELERTPPSNNAPLAGEAFALPRSVDATTAVVAASYGDEFAAAFDGAPVGSWLGPLHSRYGFHVVGVLGVEPSRPASYDDVRESLRLEYAVFRREQAVAAFMKQSFGRYRIETEAGAPSDYQPSHRLAARSAPSAED